METPKKILDDLSSALCLIEAISVISCEIGGEYDQAVRDIVRLINEHGSGYKETEYGDMTIPLLKSLHTIVRRKVDTD